MNFKIIMAWQMICEILDVLGFADEADNKGKIETVRQ